MERLLDGVRVVDLTHAYAGPCTYQLALLGADVIKVEPPDGGDDFRVWLASTFVAINAGKRSVTLDLKKREGQKVLHELVEHADLLVENYRPGVAAKLGIDWEVLHDRNRRLVYCSITGFGETGPLRDAPAIEWAVQAAAGVTSAYLTEDDDPTRPGLAVVDSFSGFTAVTAILSALLRRERTGEGTRLDISMMDAALALLSAPVTEAVNGDKRSASLPGSGRFKARDRWLYVSAVHEKWFRALCEVLGVAELIADARFSDPRGRALNRNELDSVLGERFVTRDAAEWERELNARGVPASVVRTLDEAARHPQVEQRGLLREVDVGGNRISVVGSPFSIPGLDQNPDPPRVPELGEHTDEILREHGFDVDVLRAAGAI